MRLTFLAAALLAFTLPAAAQHRRVVVAEIEDQAIRPLLSPPEIAGLVEPELVLAQKAKQQRLRFEQSWIKRGPAFRLEVDAQFADGNDFLMSLSLEEVEYGDKRLLVLVRER